MKVLIVEPGKYPREADIEHTLEAEQEVVGGTCLLYTSDAADERSSVGLGGLRLIKKKKKTRVQIKG